MFDLLHLSLHSFFFFYKKIILSSKNFYSSMRHHRSAKFAEYLSTYAILHYIGLHPTVVIEKKDSSAGYGVFVRDACDAGTTLLVVPSRRCASNSVLRILGTPVPFPFSSPLPASRSNRTENASERSAREGMASGAAHPIPSSVPLFSSSSASALVDSLENGLISSFTQASAREWIEWCWRISLEAHRSCSPLWGWLSALPTSKEMGEKASEVSRQCSLHHLSIAPYYEKGWRRLQEEMTQAYALLEPETLTAPPPTFFWAGLQLLSRGVRLPCCWRRRRRGVVSSSDSLPTPAAHPMPQMKCPEWSPDEGDEENVGEELGIVPFVDLINGADERGREGNARIEIACVSEELPDWYMSFLQAEGGKKDRGGEGREGERWGRMNVPVEMFLSRLFNYHFCVCVTLEKPLRPAEEVILDYHRFSSGALSTGGALTEVEDAQLTRFLKFLY